ncbi:hypothetical protein I352_00871 [Cryptococcus deuterogattii MMRL2647]|nr:hypothetical protein I352_00871 [Cryptococcus deuterogattii MMRL2647]
MCTRNLTQSPQEKETGQKISGQKALKTELNEREECQEIQERRRLERKGQSLQADKKPPGGPPFDVKERKVTLITSEGSKAESVVKLKRRVEGYDRAVEHYAKNFPSRQPPQLARSVQEVLTKKPDDPFSMHLLLFVILSAFYEVFLYQFLIQYATPQSAQSSSSKRRRSSAQASQTQTGASANSGLQHTATPPNAQRRTPWYQTETELH